MRPDDARRILQAERERLLDVRKSLEHDRLSEESQRRSISELSGTDEHLADVASETTTRETELSVLSTVEAELVAVEAAIARVEAGTYGTCARCGAPIADERLRAVPATAFCIDDQGAAELERSIVDDHGCTRSIENEALLHLDLLPQDDEDLGVGPEESAMADHQP